MVENPLNFQAYKKEITLLDPILDGLGRKEAERSHQTFDEARQTIWTDLQKAYFNGQVMWLRKIDKVFGKGMLRRIGELLTMSELSTGDQFQKLIADLRSKVEEIKNASH